MHLMRYIFIVHIGQVQQLNTNRYSIWDYQRVNK